MFDPENTTQTPQNYLLFAVALGWRRGFSLAKSGFFSKVMAFSQRPSSRSTTPLKGGESVRVCLSEMEKGWRSGRTKQVIVR